MKKTTFLTFLLSGLILLTSAFPQPVNTGRMDNFPGKSTEIQSQQLPVISQVPSGTQPGKSLTAPDPLIIQSDPVTAFAWNAYPANTGIPTGPITIELPAGNMQSIQDINPDIVIMSGADFVDGQWLATSLESNSGLYSISTTTGHFQLRGKTGVSITGLAYDMTSGILYGSGADGMFSFLFTIDPQTAVTQSAGLICEGAIVGIAADSDGNIYGINVFDNSLYQIDKSTGQGNLVGSLGINIQYAQDIAFDRDNHILYGTLFTADTVGGLYEIDVATGSATLLNNIGAELTAFAVPYTVPDELSPAAPQDFTVTAGPSGDLSAHLSWANPSETFSGEQLSEITGVNIYRDNVLIHSLDNVQPGSLSEYTDNAVPSKGIYGYKIAAVNSQGEGAVARYSLYIGPDVPAPVANLSLTAPDGNAHLSWQAPDSGLNGGYFPGENLSYEIVRYPDDVLLESGFQGNTYVDSSFPDQGNYFYSITAINDQGAGGTAVSTVLLLGAEGMLFLEVFDFPDFSMPPGWWVEGKGQFNWSVRESNYAGGRTPEMYFYFKPFFEGLSRLVTPPVFLYDNQQIVVTFNSRISNFSYLFDNDHFAVDVSYDNGQSWQQQWVFLADTDLGPELLRVHIDAPDNATEMLIGFRFEGDSGNVMEWAIDDVMIKKSVESRIFAESLKGDHFPVAGDNAVYKAVIINEGSGVQDNYNVKLISNQGDILASASGPAIAFGERATIDLQWTPQESELDISNLYALVEYGDQQSSTAELPVIVNNAGTGISNVGEAVIAYGQFSGIPYNFDDSNCLTQTIYYPEEMEVIGGEIIGIALHNHFMTGQIQPVEVYIGTTHQQDLSDQYISTDLQELVFSGYLELPPGKNPIMIEFDEPFSYHGGDENLVITFRGIYSELRYFPPNRFMVSETPEYPHRTRTFSSSTFVFDPPDIMGFGYSYPLVANTTFIIDASSMGTLMGNATDLNGAPLEGVSLKALNTGAVTLTDSTGQYRFRRLPTGDNDIQASRKGYYNSQKDVSINQGQTSEINFTLEPLPLITITGMVTTSDFPQTGLADAVVELSGYDMKSGITITDGSFSVEGVYGDVVYTLSVSFEGYDTYVAEIMPGNTDFDTGTIILTETAHPPFNVFAEEMEDQINITWEEAGSAFETEFRYDDGEADIMIGEWPSDFNTVYGSVHRNHAQLNEISWQLRHEYHQFPHDYVKVWVVGLDEYGEPDPSQIVYSAEVPNKNKQWNYHEFSQPVVMENGFLVGVSADNHIGLGVDDGEGEPYGFRENTHYVIMDITSDESFTAFEDRWEGWFSNNFMIRANGWDYGPVTYKSRDSQKALQSYTVRRLTEEQMHDDPQTWTELATGHSTLDFSDQHWDELPAGHYLYAIVAEYSNGVYSRPAFSNFMPKDMHAGVNLNISTNSGDSPVGAFLRLSNLNGNPQHVYSATVPPNGSVIFPGVWKGNYQLEITLEGFVTYHTSNLEITDDFTYDAELTEDIVEPFNLFVDTEFMEEGQAHFSWNNPFIGELLEGFEGVFPPDEWILMNPAGGSGWTVINSGTTPLPGWEGGEAIPAPDGENLMAYVTWMHGGEEENDQWLVTSKVRAREGHVLSFYLRYWPNAYADNVDILISTTSQDDPDAFEITVDKLEFQIGSNIHWNLYSYDLNDFVEPGTDIYIAFRHHSEITNTSGAAIMLDNVYVGQPVDSFVHKEFSTRALQGYNVFLDDMQTPVATGLTDPQFMFEDLEPGTYQAGVQSVYTTGMSPVVSIDFALGLPSVIFNITDEQGNDLPGAVITFNGQTLSDTQRIVANVPPGNYQYTVDCQGYQSVEGQLAVDDTDLEVDIVMLLEGVNVPGESQSPFKVYPNPADDTFFLSSPQAIRLVRLFDLTGRIVLEKEAFGTELSVNVRSLNNGIYLMQIFSDQNTSIHRVQVSR